MLCDWEGLAMQHRFSGLSTYGLTGPQQGGEHPADAQEECGSPFFILFIV